MEAPPTSEALAQAQEIVDSLFSDMHCTRVTFRTQAPNDPLGPLPVLVESRGHSPPSSVRTLIGDTTIDVRTAATFQACGASGKMLIQEDLMNPKEGVAPPKELMEVYGARSQMLCPVMKAVACIGVTSIHEGKGARVFTEEERGILVKGTRGIVDALGLGGTVSEEFMMG